MTRYTPQWLQSGSYSGAQDRRLIGALWPAAASSGCAVSVASGMTVNVAAGQVAVPSPNNTGTTLCTSDATEQVAMTAAHASLNRIDLVICRPRGTDLDGGANNDFIFDHVDGTPAASPIAPATPAGTVALNQVYVGAGVAALLTANLTDVRPGGLPIGTTVLPPNVPLGRIASGVGPASQTDYTTAATVLTVNANLVAGRRYRASANGIVSQQNAVGTPYLSLTDNPSNYIPGGMVRFIYTYNLPGAVATGGSGFWTFVATATATVAFIVTAQASTGVCRIGANCVQLVVEDIGI